MSNQVGDRIKEMMGIMLIGDGVLAAAWPRQHSLLWLSGPRVWRDAVRPFADNPNMTRVLGLAELAFGIWLARDSMRDHGEDEDPAVALPSL